MDTSMSRNWPCRVMTTIVESHAACSWAHLSGKQGRLHRGFAVPLLTYPWTDFQSKSGGVGMRWRDCSRQRGQQRQRSNVQCCILFCFQCCILNRRTARLWSVLVGLWEWWFAGTWDRIELLLPTVFSLKLRTCSLASPSLLVLFKGQFRCFLGNSSLWSSFIYIKSTICVICDESLLVI